MLSNSAFTVKLPGRSLNPKIDKRVKVLHTIGFLGFGGMEGGVIKLVNRLDRAHFIPHVVALRDFDNKAKNTLEKDIKFKCLNKKDGKDWSIVTKLEAYLTQNGIDIIHSHNWETFVYSYLAARIARVPVFIHGEHGRDTEKVTETWLKSTVKIFIARKSDKLTTVSEDIANLMVEKWRVRPEKIITIRNGVDRENFRPRKNKRSAKEILELPDGSLIIGTIIGSLRPVKDLPTLLRAFEIVKKSNASAKLVVVGGMEEGSAAWNGNSYYSEVKSIIKEACITKDVLFTGIRQDIPVLMQAFDVYANSSVYEGMSNTLLEAMSCGIPVIATNVGGTPMIVKDGFNGFLVPSKSPEILAQRICQMLQGTELRQRLTKNGVEYVRQNHSLERFVTSHEKLYKREYYSKLSPKL